MALHNFFISRWLFLPFLLGVMAPLSGQPLDQFFGTSANQRMVASAAEGCVVVVRQRYRLKGPSGQTYGREGRAYYGSYVTAGVLSKGAIYLNAEAKEPWANDPAYVEFSGRDSLQPEPYTLDYRTVADSSWTTAEEGGRTSIAGKGTRISIGGGDGAPSVASLSPTTTTLEDYWMVTVLQEDPDEEVYKLTTFRPEFAENGYPTLKKLPFAERVVGGVLFALHFQPGVMLLVGEATVKVAGETGELVPLALATAAAPPRGAEQGEEPPTETPPPGGNGLTPVGEGAAPPSHAENPSPAPAAAPGEAEADKSGKRKKRKKKRRKDKQ